MTKFLLTKKLQALIEQSSLDKDKKKKFLSQESIDHSDLVSFYRQTKPCSSLLELLKTTKLVIPNKNTKNEEIPKSKEFLASMEKLRLQAREDDYQRLVQKSQRDPFKLYEQKVDDDWNPARAHKEVRSHITTIFNIFISVVSVVYAVWYWTSSSVRMKDSYRVLLCLFAGILILVAEVVVYLGYLNKIEDARVRERSKKEVKKVIQTIKLE
ncbi:hypothetical protein FT663_00872 [Candidozyma haemuli var. vulneris]|uniref:Vacuolar ATPase assembly integral membrane protein VPH2 n=1 Tax=Candidozyma haemuli TaxID=45357 RepID=A0A2V1AW01_9ASCO|nr:hypothetical protein CXQ85_004637 [[Candida] haemuloni]KAF3990936.1 hypothetical protein FT662_01993 [[Candida] haemuloni var. vulneris]KAF3995036.1 hypothetical protein FT663_00872 [[Candida] haemuloni var. vulneris]PVH21972.1 hypothetical protein CXQ85_004637 [[Candida] haemuloni]